MGNILAAIENSGIDEVEAGGMIWRVRKICSADLAKVGHAALAMAQGFDGKDRTGAEPEGDDLAARIGAQPVEQLQTMAKLKDAIIAAGLMAVGDPATGEWENVEPMINRDEADAQGGKLWVGSLPSEIADALFESIMSLSTDGGAALERLHTFRKATRNPANRRSGGKKVRKTAK